MNESQNRTIADHHGWRLTFDPEERQLFLVQDDGGDVGIVQVALEQASAIAAAFKKAESLFAKPTPPMIEPGQN